MTPEEITANLPPGFKEYADTQVIVDCTELRCQTPSSLVLQNEVYSHYKSHCTFKAMIGMAPHGPLIDPIDPAYPPRSSWSIGAVYCCNQGTGEWWNASAIYCCSQVLSSSPASLPLTVCWLCAAWWLTSLLHLISSPFSLFGRDANRDVPIRFFFLPGSRSESFSIYYLPIPSCDPILGLN